ncbi:MAG TPA: putative toxin-antitoxin system toxin component, PIN family [Accumulibacter sp.]|jgi:putative PIN family toxin of toxin-antitoxin system|nr:putative toxin-antitoxin system toxin component, PIN family [Accumulibacter sp.]HQC81208.1 putative toxin-antitoxin system toxin component, PIN family [Accumulibacter sp.]
MSPTNCKASEPLRAVLDTNVVLDLLHFADPRTRTLQAAIRHGVLRCFSDQACLAELTRVLAYPRFALAAPAREALLGRYLRMVTPVTVIASDADRPLPRCRDADDQKFLVLAARCRADLLLTADRSLLTLARHRLRPCAILSSEAAAARLAPFVAFDDTTSPDGGSELVC